MRHIRRTRIRDIGSRDLIARAHPADRPTSRMRRNRIGDAPLSIRQINRHSQHTLWLDLEINRIRDDQSSVWNRVVLASRERDSLESI